MGEQSTIYPQNGKNSFPVAPTSEQLVSASYHDPRASDGHAAPARRIARCHRDTSEYSSSPAFVLLSIFLVPDSAAHGAAAALIPSSPPLPTAGAPPFSPFSLSPVSESSALCSFLFFPFCRRGCFALSACNCPDSIDPAPAELGRHSELVICVA